MSARVSWRRNASGEREIAASSAWSRTRWDFYGISAEFIFLFLCQRLAFLWIPIAQFFNVSHDPELVAGGYVIHRELEVHGGHILVMHFSVPK